MRRWPLIVAMAAASVALVTAVVPIARDVLTPKPRVIHIGTPDVGGPFTLVNQHGITLTEKDLVGKPFVVTFGHSKDTDQTRLLLRVLFQTFTRMGAAARDVTPVFITIDPTVDTPETLGPFAASHSAVLVALSGQPEAVAKVIKAYRVYVARVVDEDAPGGTRLEYQPLYFVMDINGRYVGHADFTPSPKQLEEELAPLIRRARTGK